MENPFEVIFWILGFIVAIPFLIYFYPTRFKENGFIFTNYPLKHNEFGSFPNPERVTSGYWWSSVFDLKKELKKRDNSVFIDFFRFDKEFAKKSRMKGLIKNKVESTKLYFTPLEMTQSLLFVGKMGSGKTQILFNFLNQKFYNRTLIHQVKSGDMVEPYYRSKIDIILNPYEQRSHLWDIMNEDEGIVKTFFENYMNAVIGDKKDFFSATANRKFNETMIKIKTAYKNETSAKKWLLFIQAIKEMFADAHRKDQNSTKDVVSTMEGILEPLEIMAWQMQQKGQKTFTIKEFFKRKNQAKLILDNNAGFASKLTPLFSAFVACFSQVHLSMPDTKKDFTLYALDEYISLAKTMDEASKTRIHTLIRSKGGILMSFLQYIPKDDKKLEQLLTSSAFAWFFFSVIDDNSIELLKKTVGETQYYHELENISYSDGKKSKSYSVKEDKTHLITSDKINALAQNFEHIVYIPNKKLLYKGYTPSPELKVRAKKFIERDISKFSEIKHKNMEKKSQQEIQNLTFDDLFKEMPRSKRYELSQKYLKAKQQGKVKEFAQQNNIVDVDFNLLFDEFMPDDKVLENKMKVLSLEERFKLAQEWNSISEDDYDAQIAFIDKYELWGACPNIFQFSEDELEQCEMGIEL